MLRCVIRRHVSRGLTIVEMIVALVVAAILITMIYTIWSSATRTSRGTGAHLGAIQSVLIASQAIRSDLAKMFFTPLAGENQAAADNIRIDPAGVQLQFHVPSNLDSQAWKLDLMPVVYFLRPIDGEKSAFQLMKRDPSGDRPIAGCLLGGIHFQYLPKGEVAPYRAYLQVTLEGIDHPQPRARFPASLLIPLTQTLPPAAFAVDPSGFRGVYPGQGS